MNHKTRIEADSEKYLERNPQFEPADENITDAYISGATKELERAKVLVDAIELVLQNYAFDTVEKSARVVILENKLLHLKDALKDYEGE